MEESLLIILIHLCCWMARGVSCLTADILDLIKTDFSMVLSHVSYTEEETHYCNLQMFIMTLKNSLFY